MLGGPRSGPLAMGVRWLDGKMRMSGSGRDQLDPWVGEVVSGNDRWEVGTHNLTARSGEGFEDSGLVVVAVVVVTGYGSSQAGPPAPSSVASHA